MVNLNLVRGLFLAVLALAFGLGALRYPIGSLARPGPGLFPLLISALLFTLGIVALLQSRVMPFTPFAFNLRSIGLIMAALIGFVMLSKLLNTITAIIFLVLVSSFAATTQSWKRSVILSVVLIAVAFGFQRLVGLNLRLI